MASRHRKLLPASSPSGITAVSCSERTQLLKRRRSAVRVACTRCRARKTSCSGDRPRCLSCIKRNHECDYGLANEGETRHTALTRELAELNERLREHEDVLQHLGSVPEDEGLAIIRRLKSTPDVGAILASLKSPASSCRPSDLETARATIPVTTSSMEFELAVLHGKAYVIEPSIDTLPIDVETIFGQRTHCVLPYTSTNALIDNYQNLSRKPVTGTQADTILCGPPSPLQGIAKRPQSIVLGPLPDRVYCDARLRQVNFRYWTTVPVSDEYAACVLSVYFENEHAIIGTFDIDTFLDDLVDGRLDFCSSFLVSTVLGLACLCFSSLDPRALPLATAFIAEAQTLWTSERSTDTVTNLAGMTTLGVVTMMSGEEQVSLQAFGDSRLMAERMALIGLRHDDQQHGAFRRMQDKKIRAYAQAAWGCYNWLSVHASYYGGEPISFPPVLPIPGLPTNRATADWSVQSRMHFLGNTFAGWSRLWVISQEIQALYYRKDASSSRGTTSLASAESKYHKLLLWAGNLDHGMTRKNQRFPHVIILHAYFHIIVLDLFRPFLDSGETLRLRTISSEDSTPEAVFNASLRQLQKIILDYTSNYDPRFYNFVLNGAVLHNLHLVLQRKDAPAARVHLDLGMGWMKEIYARFAVIGKVAQAYMAIGMGAGVISATEARDFMQAMEQRGRYHDLNKVAVSCIVDFKVAMSSKHDGRAQDLAQRFDELALFNEAVADDWLE